MSNYVAGNDAFSSQVSDMTFRGPQGWGAGGLRGGGAVGRRFQGFESHRLFRPSNLPQPVHFVITVGPLREEEEKMYTAAK